MIVRIRQLVNQRFATQAMQFSMGQQTSASEGVKNVLATHGQNAVFLDVRSEAEVAAKSLEGQAQEVLFVPCTRDDASMLKSKAGEILPDKTAHVIVFCRSGARASMAKNTLEDLGYQNVS